MSFKCLILSFILFIYINQSNQQTFKEHNDRIKLKSNKTWAVLVAGSAGWDNYRHQADVLHLYQVLTKFLNIPKHKIILMIKDDLANSSLNPHKGVIINEPNGENLYTPDLVKDYTGDYVTKDNFLKVISGDPDLIKKGKKVLNSTSDENVLLYYSDHGNLGFINFPDGILSATILNDHLENLAKKNKFKKMVIAIEACYSGSIFDQNLLKSNLNIYAITASNSDELSWAEFSENEIYLADVFSHNFIYSLISCDNSNSTIAEEYEIIKNQTTTSHVEQFGDVKLARTTKLDDFLHPIDSNTIIDKCINKNRLDKLDENQRLLSAGPDVKFTIFEYLKRQNKLTKDHIRIFERLKRGRDYLKNHFFKLGNLLAKSLNLNFKNLIKTKEGIKDRKCYEQIVNLYHDNCYKLNEHTYLGRYLYLFANTCNNLINSDNKSIKIEELKSLILEECKASSLEEFDFIIE